MLKNWSDRRTRAQRSIRSGTSKSSTKSAKMTLRRGRRQPRSFSARPTSAKSRCVLQSARKRTAIPLRRSDLGVPSPDTRTPAQLEALGFQAPQGILTLRRDGQAQLLHLSRRGGKLREVSFFPPFPVALLRVDLCDIRANSATLARLARLRRCTSRCSRRKWSALPRSSLDRTRARRSCCSSRRFVRPAFHSSLRILVRN